MIIEDKIKSAEDMTKRWARGETVVFPDELEWQSAKSELRFRTIDVIMRRRINQAENYARKYRGGG